MRVPSPRGVSAQQAAGAAQHPSSWAAPWACLQGDTVQFPCMGKVTFFPLCLQGDATGSTSLQPAGCQGRAGSIAPLRGTSVHPGSPPTPAPLAGTAPACHIPPALRPERGRARCRLGPGQRPRAQLVFTTHHKPPSAPLVPKLQHSDALGAKQVCCTLFSAVTVKRGRVSESSSELVAQLGFCSSASQRTLCSNV